MNPHIKSNSMLLSNARDLMFARILVIVVADVLRNRDNSKYIESILKIMGDQCEERIEYDDSKGLGENFVVFMKYHKLTPEFVLTMMFSDELYSIDPNKSRIDEYVIAACFHLCGGYLSISDFLLLSNWSDTAGIRVVVEHYLRLMVLRGKLARHDWADLGLQQGLKLDEYVYCMEV